jgi:periplasmic copper chaperone A
VNTYLSRMRPVLAALALLAAAPASAHEVKAGSITVVHPIARASIGQAPNTAAYMTLKNAGSTPDRLLSASCACARKVEVHAMSTAGGRMVMRPAGPVTIAPGGQVNFKPGGLHLMVMGLKGPLEAGTTTELTLVFEKAGPAKATFFVTARVEEELNAHGGGHRH